MISEKAQQLATELGVGYVECSAATNEVGQVFAAIDKLPTKSGANGGGPLGRLVRFLQRSLSNDDAKHRNAADPSAGLHLDSLSISKDEISFAAD
jgi:hypothetical protein